MSVRKRIAIVMLLFVVAALVGVSLMRFTDHSDVEAQSTGVSSLKTLDNMALASSNSVDAESINNLLNQAVLSITANEFNFSDFPAIRQRIIQTEIKYRNNQRSGIPEVKVVEALNGLAIRFNTPSYASTNEPEIRELRVGLAKLTPNFIGRYRPSEYNPSLNQGLNPNLSPVEAVYVSIAMMEQKMSSPYYQMTHAERLAKWESLNSAGGIDSLPLNDDRVQEMSNKVRTGTTNMTLSDAQTILNRALDIMGFELQ